MFGGKPVGWDLPRTEARTDADGLAGWMLPLPYSNEGQEPPRIHVKAGGDEAKFRLDPIALAANHGFNARDLNEIERLVEQHRAGFLEAWDEHLG